jgi:hypothetical protein
VVKTILPLKGGWGYYNSSTPGQDERSTALPLVVQSEKKGKRKTRNIYIYKKKKKKKKKKEEKYL